MNFLHMLPFDFIYFLIDDSNKQPLWSWRLGIPSQP
jgi:hypothetical protein